MALSFRLLEFESPSGTQVTQIDREAAYSMEEDFLNQNVYKPICELKEVNEVLSILIMYN